MRDERDDETQDLEAAVPADSGSAAPGGTPHSERYSIEEEIARGGMGVIYRVRDEELRRSLAMKVLLGFASPDGKTEGSEYASRFLEEAQVTAQLAHPGVVPVHELGIDATGRVFFTMSLVRGKTLSEVVELAREGRDGWSMTRALQVILRVCETLAFAHDKGVIHRDIKPDNVMVGRFGETYLMDWGLAKVIDGVDLHDIRLQQDPTTKSVIESKRSEDSDDDARSPIMTMDGAVVGTPAYMPPEQARGQAELVDMRSDVYAVGTLLYELLTGQPPYVPPGSNISPRTVLVAVHMGPPTPISDITDSMPEELVSVCEKAMSRERDDRYATAVELAEDLQRFLSGHVVRAHKTGALIEMRKWIERNRLAAALLVAVAAAVIVGLGVSLHLLDRSQESELASRQAVYRAKLGVVVSDLQRGSYAAAEEKLESIEPEFRAWEWEVLSAKTDHTLRRIRGVGPTFDADGRLWVVRDAEDGRGVVESWNLTTGEHTDVATIPSARGAHVDPVSGYAACEADGDAVVFELRSGERVLEVDGASPLKLFGRPAPTLIVEDGRDSVRVLDVATGDLRFEFGRRELEVSHSGKRIAFADDRKSRVVIADIDAPHLPQTISGITPDKAMAFTPDDTQLLIVDRDDWRLLDLGSRESSDWFVRVRPGDAGAVATRYAPDGRQFAYGTDTWSVCLADAGKRGDVLHAWHGHEAKVNRIRFSPDGAFMVSQDGAGWTLVWPHGANAQPDSLTRHASFAYAASFSPDGSLMASGGWDGYVEASGCVRISDVETGEEVAAWGRPSQRALWAEFFPDGKRLLTLIADDLDWGGRLRAWDVRTGDLLWESPERVFGADLDPAGQRIVAVCDLIGAGTPDENTTGELCTIDVATRQLCRSGETSLVVNVSPQFLGDGRRLAAALQNLEIGLWNADTLERSGALTGTEGVANRLAESPDGRFVAAAAKSDEEDGVKDATVHIWDAGTGAHVAGLPGHGSGALAVTFSPDGTRIITGGRDGTVNVWDAHTYEKIVGLAGHEGYVYHVTYDPSGQRLVSVGMDGGVRIWETTPFRDRFNRRAPRAAIIARLAPDIEAQLDAGTPPTDLADALESRTDLSARERGVALQVLLAESIRRRE